MKRFAQSRLTRISAILLILAILASVFVVVQGHAATPPAWDGNSHAYAVGDQVTYQSNIYQCIQPHTSQPGWDPVSVPSLWKLIGPVGSNPTNTPGAVATNTPKPGSTSTPKPPPTSTPKPGSTSTPKPVATNTPKPAPTNTPGGTTCTAAPWNSATAYNGGAQVSYNGHLWTAKWWTQGDIPGGTTNAGVWSDNGPCSGGSNPTSTPKPGSTSTPKPGPTNTPRPAATNTPFPTPPPCNSACGKLPHRVFVGYWHNFDNGTGFIPLTNVPAAYDVIEVAFGVPAGGGAMQFTPYNETPAQFAADVATMHSRGKKVLLSFSGYNDPFSITDAGMAANFTSSVTAIVRQYGFDGIDIDAEQHSVYLAAGDTDVTHPTSPAVVYLIQGIRGVANNIGSSFMLTLAPETMYTQVGYSHYGPANGSDDRSGSYLPVIYALRDIISWVQTQDYNSGPIMGFDGQYHNMGSADFHVTMSEMLLKGFKIPGGNSTFPGLRDDQIVMGTPAGSSAGQGFLDAGTVGQAMSTVMGDGYPNLRGVMTWSINWDVYYSSTYGNGIRSYLNSHP